MWRALALALSAIVLAPAVAAAQTQSAPSQIGPASPQDCDRLVAALRAGADVPGVTLDIAQEWQARGYEVGCRLGLERMGDAGAPAASGGSDGAAPAAPRR